MVIAASAGHHNPFDVHVGETRRFAFGAVDDGTDVIREETLEAVHAKTADGAVDGRSSQRFRYRSIWSLGSKYPVTMFAGNTLSRHRAAVRSHCCNYCSSNALRGQKNLEF